METGRLQDIEANIEMLKSEGKMGLFFHRLNCPAMIFTKRIDWIKILEFKKKQEIEKIKFFENLEKK